MGRAAENEFIRLRGLRQNNLKGFDLDLPLGRLIVVTGLSGAGKSSLVFETLHAEGQRRYVETFSPYTRQFLELLDRPKLDAIHNIRPSIAIQQSNSVKTSRSTVGTMTELTDYFKVWFCHVAQLFDPETGQLIEDDNANSIWEKTVRARQGQTLLICFPVEKPKLLSWEEVLQPIKAQGYTRILVQGVVRRVQSIDPSQFDLDQIFVIQDRLKIAPPNRHRFIDSAQTALHYGQGKVRLFRTSGEEACRYAAGLRSPATGKTFQPADPSLFSFNSPIGACPKCRGFGRIIQVDYAKAIPNQKLSIDQGAIKAWQGAVYGESNKDLLLFCKKESIPTHIPFADLTQEQRDFVINGDPNYGKTGHKWPQAWYGLKGFFRWLESKAYRMHVRVFLSRFRSYGQCPRCGGARLRPEALNWRWRNRTLPSLYAMPIQELRPLLRENFSKTGDLRVDLAYDSIVARLAYLEQVGLGYLTLDRASRTLSGGEIERVNLTSCLGSSLVDTLFVLDEPSIGLHSRDIDRLIAILRRLTDLGNTVVVVEHDESIIRAADQVLEIGPNPGADGGRLVFQGPLHELLRNSASITGQYLSDRRSIPLPDSRRTQSSSQRKFPGNQPLLRFHNVSKHNIDRQNFEIPLRCLVCLTGVSGSGKSTLLDNVIYQNLRLQSGVLADDPATVASIDCEETFSDIVLVDQGPVSKTPRSNPLLFIKGWDEVRKLFAATEEAVAQGLSHAYFSFNSGDGRCEHCAGLGYERVEMQFLSDVFVNCPACEGERFKSEILGIKWRGKSIADILRLTVDEGLEFFASRPRLVQRLQSLLAVGLGYITLGQPLNTLSGGESQRLKLVKYFSQVDGADAAALLLLDEPTTGLHKHDVRRLIEVLHHLVDRGHSVMVIEHHMDVVKCADWVIELGPEAGLKGGKVIAQGTPEQVAQENIPTQPFLIRELNRSHENIPAGATYASPLDRSESVVAEEPPNSIPSPNLPLASIPQPGGYLQILGARQHNLRNVSLSIPHHEISVVTGVSGSGKSSLAFDIVFAEGQRRFLESTSAYARQFVEQLPRPDVDDLRGIAPTAAIEQRVSRGSRKSTVATVTEVAQYLRLLYARLGVQHSPHSGLPVVSLTHSALAKRLEKLLEHPKFHRAKRLYLAAPIVRGRKGHHRPIVNWLAKQGFDLMRIDGQLVEIRDFRGLSRYQEHDIEVIVTDLGPGSPSPPARSLSQKNRNDELSQILRRALQLGKNSAILLDSGGEILTWLSTERVDPSSGLAFPELDPKHFSWNSSKGWCAECNGNGNIWQKREKRRVGRKWFLETCPTCRGKRLNALSSHVFLNFENGPPLSLPKLLQLAPGALSTKLDDLKLDERGKAVVVDILPQIRERLRFMGKVGLDYLSLDRSISTLSNGEVQRVRLAAQLGSNLSGVLYVLDEPSIGLHARDNGRLIASLQDLKSRGNTLLVVEHDEDTMEQADHIIDLGPGAGIHGGEVLANGSLSEILHSEKSLTAQYLKRGIPHPIRGHYRKLPHPYRPRSRKKQDWLLLKKPRLRNLKGDDLLLPLNKLIMVAGISGAGKSTLIRDLLRPVVDFARRRKKKNLSEAEFSRSEDLPNTHAGKSFLRLINGTEFRSVIEVDQNPIGKTPRSTPATYTGAMDIIRQIFAAIPAAKARGMTTSSFSFNTRHGRCETCKGLGQIKLEMNFLPNAYVACQNCGGSRYGPELDDIRWKGKSIAEILQMTFEEAADFFEPRQQLGDLLSLMTQTGLGYLTLGQSSPTLSGGEAQRLKLVRELAKGLPSFRDKSRGLKFQNLYILEEPTIGLHLSDCERLIQLLHQLVDQGHTVVVIEHHLDLLAEADYLVEIGPEGGAKGGHILYQGPVNGLLHCAISPTLPYLKPKLTVSGG